jgi:Domain of unknown function (DUF6933)
MVLRCTSKVLGLLGVGQADLALYTPSDDDWYVNLLWIERRKCLLLTHVRTLFPILAADVRKGDVVPVEPYVVGLVEGELRSEGLRPDALGSLEPSAVSLARTESRSMLAVMNNTASQLRYQVASMGGIGRAQIEVVNHLLRRTPHLRDGEWLTPVDLVSVEASRPSTLRT